MAASSFGALMVLPRCKPSTQVTPWNSCSSLLTRLCARLRHLTPMISQTHHPQIQNAVILGLLHDILASIHIMGLRVHLFRCKQTLQWVFTIAIFVSPYLGSEKPFVRSILHDDASRLAYSRYFVSRQTRIVQSSYFDFELKRITIKQSLRALRHGCASLCSNRQSVPKTRPSVQRKHFSALCWCHLSCMPVAFDLGQGRYHHFSEISLSSISAGQIRG